MLRKKIFWQVVLGLLMLALCVYFIKSQHLEFGKITAVLRNANPGYVILGVLVTAIYIFLQALMYVESFACVNKKVSLVSTLSLFLKRNLVSVFLPAGGFSSLAFFTKEIEKQRINKSEIYFASYIYGVCGMVSVIIVAIPTFIFMLFKRTLTSTEIYAFIVLTVLVLMLIWLGYSLIKKGRIYKLTRRYIPSLALLVDELESADFNLKHFLLTTAVSLLIEFAGIAHLYIAMLALGIQPSIELAFVGYVIMVILLIVSPVLRGIGPIEVTMTFLFVHYGLSTIIAASATLLFRLFEFWLPLLAGVISFYVKRDNIVLRIMPAIIILLLGLINIISAITPPLPERLGLIAQILSHNMIYASNFLVLVFGLTLCVVSIYLLRGVRSAWWAAIVLAVLSIVGHLSKAIDYEEATLALFALLSLIISRKAYAIPPDRSFQKKGLANFTIVFAAVIVYGVVGFYFLDKRHFGIDFDLKHSIISLLRIFFLFDNGNLEAKTHFGKYFLYSIYATGLTTIIFAIYTIVKPYFTSPAVAPEDTAKATELVKKYGNSPLDFYKTYNDKLYYFGQVVEGFIAFRTTGIFAVVLEKPVCADNDEAIIIITEFEKYCNGMGLRPIYYRVSEEDLPIYKLCGKKALKIGQEAIVDLETFVLTGKEMKPIRNAVNKISASGFVLKVLEPPIKEGNIQKMKQVSNEWLSSDRKKEVVFTNGIFDSTILKNQTILIVENSEEKIVAFTNLIPDYVPEEATYDMVRKSNDAPNGVIDFLFIQMFEYLKSQGFKKVNMGLAPMAGIEQAENITEQTIKFAYENIRLFWHYRGLREYKEKFGPRWINKYLIYSFDYDLLQVPKALNEVTKLEE